MKLIRPILAAFLTLAIAQSVTPQFAEAADMKVISGGAFKQVLNALAGRIREGDRHESRCDLPNRRAASQAHRQRRRGVRRGGADARGDRKPCQGRQGGARQPRRSRQDRRRRRGQRRARRFPTSARSRPSSVRFWRRSRSPISIRRPADRAASMSASCWRSSASPRRSTPRRCWSRAAKSPPTSSTARPKSASTRSAKSSPVKGVDAGRAAAGRHPELHRLFRRREHRAPTIAAAASALVKFLSGPHALPIIKSKGMEPAGSNQAPEKGSARTRAGAGLPVSIRRRAVSAARAPRRCAGCPTG